MKKRKNEMAACLKEMEASQKKAEASFKHHEAEQGRLKEELSPEETLEAACRKNADLKA